MKMRKFTWLFVIVLSLGLVVGCTNNDPTANGDNGTKVADDGSTTYEIAGILMQSDVEWFKHIEKGMQDAAAEFNVDLTIGNSNLEVTEEANLIDTYAAQGKDAVLVSAIDFSASSEAIKRAQAEDVLVVNYNTNVEEDVEEYFVGINNFDLGYQAGEYLVSYVNENLDGKAKVAMVTLSMFGIGQERADGFLEAIQNEPGIEVVAEQDASGPEEGADVTETMLQANPDIDLIWAANEGGAIGAVVGVESKGLKDKIKIFGTDMSVQSAGYLLDEDNPYYAVSTQKPYEIGYEALKLAVEALENESANSEVIVPLDLYTKEDLDRVQEYLDESEALME